MVLRPFLKFWASFVTVAIVIVVLLGAISFFIIRNFNPDMLRRELEQYLSEETGYRIELGKVKLCWGVLAELQADGLLVTNPQTSEKLLQSNFVQIQTNLISLGHRHFTLSRVRIQKPQVFLHRKANGIWNWQVPETKTFSKTGRLANPVVAGVFSGQPKQNFVVDLVQKETRNWEFHLGRMEVEDGIVWFVDETIQPAYELQVDQWKVEAHEKPSSKTFHFEAKAAAFGSRQANLQAEGDADFKSQSLEFTLRYRLDQIVLGGVLKLIGSVPRVSGKLEIRNLDLGEIIPEVYQKGEYVAGHMNVQAQATFEGANPAMIWQSIQGQGSVEILDGAIKNRNLIREVFDRLSPVILVMGTLGGQLPVEVDEMLRGRDTPFQSLKFLGSVTSGTIQIQQFQILHKDYGLAGKGNYKILPRQIDMALQLVFSPSISKYLVTKIHELAYLSNRNGQVLIPFRYDGVFPTAFVQPDLSYVSNQLLQIGAEQLINKGLKKLSKFLETK